MACNERGMALVSVVMLLAVLLTLAHILTEKIWQSTRQTADAANRDQLFWAAQAGVEAARQQLTANYDSSGGWQTFLAVDTPLAYPATPAWVTAINGLSVEIYLRDNPDGDVDYGKDNDLKIYVLARARGRQGTEVMVESLCGFDQADGAAPVPPAQPATGVGSGLSTQPVSTYGIAD